MTSIIEFNKQNPLKEQEKLVISNLIFDSFRQKFLGISFNINKQEWTVILSKIMTFNDGFYYQKEGVIMGIALLTSKRVPTFRSLLYIIKQLGIYKSILLSMIFISPVKSASEIKLELFAVDASARGAGIGGKLLDHLFEFAKKKRYNKITLEVVDTNPKAKKLYEKLGFRTIKKIRTSRLTNKAGYQAYYPMENTSFLNH